jgi:hypothetical protein|uniref:Uncharacterized protein n=1 Tax=viral metagenome TaxID=1070528 RepID=A0A6C0H998_9ZZZZ
MNNTDICTSQMLENVALCIHKSNNQITDCLNKISDNFKKCVIVYNNSVDKSRNTKLDGYIWNNKCYAYYNNGIIIHYIFINSNILDCNNLIL